MFRADLESRNSVAPMVLNFQNKDHDKTKYPFKLTKDTPRFHRLVLRSCDRTAGDHHDAWFNVELPGDLQGDGILTVESFVMENGDFGALDAIPYSIHIPQIHQHHSYMAGGKVSDTIFSSKGYAYNGATDQGTLGISIDNKALYSQKNWRVYFTTPTIFDISSVNNEWILTLVLFERSNSNFE